MPSFSSSNVVMIRPKPNATMPAEINNGAESSGKSPQPDLPMETKSCPRYHFQEPRPRAGVLFVGQAEEAGELPQLDLDPVRLQSK